ncbi:MAG: hypothetical protein R3270_05965 [Gammaproteobacteria bacterium]|nr:hypothetical protein [Gammaproteobacteria bacterium]
MRPLTALNGIIFGSCLSIFIGLAVTLLLFSLLAPENPSLQVELGPLGIYTLVFLGMASISGVAFLGQLKRSTWRWWAEGALALAGAGTVLFLLP